MIATDIGGGQWLHAPAAAMYRAALRDGCPIGVTSGGRSSALQEAIFRDRYTTNFAKSSMRDRGRWQGLTWWRKRGAESAATPGKSKHESGTALDLPGDSTDTSTPRGWMTVHGARYGWIAGRVPSEPWHFEFVEPATSPTPIPPLGGDIAEEDEVMYTLISFADNPEIGLFNPRTNTYQAFRTMTGVAYAQDALPLKEATFSSIGEFDSWRNTLAAVLKG